VERFEQVGGRASGHVFRREGKRGAVWYAKFRQPDGRQVQKRVGPAWLGRGRPAEGFFTERTAEAWLTEVLGRADAGELPGQRCPGVTFADAAREWLRYVEHDRAVKASTLRSYRSSVVGQLIPAFGARPLAEITTEELERWRNGLTTGPRTRNKLLTELHGIFKRARKAYGLKVNPAADVEMLKVRRKVDIDVFSPEEVRALVRAAASEQDGALFLAAAFTGMRRGELIALRWRDVDFAGSHIRVAGSYSAGELSSPKSGHVRAVPMARDLAAALAPLGQRERWTGDDDLVFPGQLGGFLDGDALGKRYKVALGRAGLRPLRFHDLRHTFGTAMIAQADIVRVKEWMGHAEVETTERYLHFKRRPDDARLADAAFSTNLAPVGTPAGAGEGTERSPRPAVPLGR
jgi:integrase